MEPVCESVGADDAGDGVADTGFILGVDHQPIVTGFIIDVEPSSVDPEFMRNTRWRLGMSVRMTQPMIDQFMS
jgi:hypothetical protein